MSFITDMDQDRKIQLLENRIKRLENKLNGGNKMSKILDSLVGQDVTISMDFEEIKCRVLDCDDDWVKLMVYGKKKDTTVIRRVDAINKVTLDKDGI